MVDDPLIGAQLGNFRLERLLGRGGMATVYYGHDVMLDRPVAIKVVDRRFRDNAAYTDRFLREARSVARWRHEHIIQVYHVGEQEGLHYMVMEYIPGGDLASLLADQRACETLLPVSEVLRIGRAIASALDFAHKQGIVHRDVKPGNVLLADDGRVVLSDFGLVLETNGETTGEMFGSPHYVAPEQARSSGGVVPASDLYALGVILYEMLVGRRPFEDPSPATLALQHLIEPPPSPRQLNPNLNQATEVVLLRALEKEPAARYPSAAALMDALEVALLGGDLAPDEGPAPLRVDVDAAELAAWSEPAPTAFVRSPLAAQASTDTLPRAPAGLRVQPNRRRSLSPWLLLIPAALLFLILVAAAYALLPGDTSGGEATSPAETPTAAEGGGQAPATPSSGDEGDEEDEAPVVAPPAGRAVQLYYDENTFYAANPNAGDVEVARLAFAALAADGSPTQYAFSGESWAAYYPFIQPGHCDRLHVVNTAIQLESAACAGLNAWMTPAAGEDVVFWRAREGVAEFAVLWDGVEVGRCPVSAGSCEVAIP
jgi:tRNA A-37 threonylcarbamoyl transferase component Bud32